MSFFSWYKRKLKESIDVFDLFLRAIQKNRTHGTVYKILLLLMGLSILLDLFNLEESGLIGFFSFTGLFIYSGNLFRTIIPDGSKYWNYRLFSYGMMFFGFVFFLILILSVVPFFYMLPWHIWSLSLNK